MITTVAVNCKVCGKAFRAKPCVIRIGGGKYCSRDCFFDASKNGETLTCETCGKLFYKTRSELQRYDSRYCSWKCLSHGRDPEKIKQYHEQYKRKHPERIRANVL